jgi:hypothetical protein
MRGRLRSVRALQSGVVAHPCCSDVCTSGAFPEDRRRSTARYDPMQATGTGPLPIQVSGGVTMGVTWDRWPGTSVHFTWTDHACKSLSCRWLADSNVHCRLASMQRVRLAVSKCQQNRESGRSLVEIKGGRGCYWKTRNEGRVPHYYMGQLQHNLAVTGFSAIDFWCYQPGSSACLWKVWDRIGRPRDGCRKVRFRNKLSSVNFCAVAALRVMIPLSSPSKERLKSSDRAEYLDFTRWSGHAV